MPDLSSLFDTLLVIAGLVLVVTGLVMFIYSKTSTQASSVEAFGIKLNVTHPSLILVLAGVGLMLAPRLLPEPPGRAGPPAPATVAEAPSTQPATPIPSATPASREPAPHPLPPAAPAPAANETPAPAATPTIKPAPSTTPPVVAVARPAQPIKPQVVKPSLAPKKSAPVPAPALVHVQPVPAPVPAATAPPAEKPAATPTAASKPARPTLAYAALGLPIDRSFWSGETRAGYTQRVRTTLQRTGREVLHMDAHRLDLGQAEFDAWWNESRQYPKSRALCAASPAPLALLSARVETPTTISSVESAYWPELQLRLFVCANQHIYRQQKTLAPQNDDTWPFSTELNSEVERFLRTYRGDLAN